MSIIHTSLSLCKTFIDFSYHSCVSVSWKTSSFSGQNIRGLEKYVLTAFSKSLVAA